MSEYEQAKQKYEQAIADLRAKAGDFSVEGHKAFLEALKKANEAYSALYFADQRQGVQR